MSRSAAPGTLKAYYPYEETLCWSKLVDLSGTEGITFRDIYPLMRRNA